MQALAQQAQDKGNMAKQDKQNGDQLVSQQDLDKMLSNIEKLAQSGSKEMAERMLSELKDILERMQAGNIPENAKQQRASRMMKDLNDVISKQQKLLDDTFDAKRKQGDNEGQQSQQFEVSPPGQPLEFGPGMSMAPFCRDAGRGAARPDQGPGRVGQARLGPRTKARWRWASSRKGASAPAITASSPSASRSSATSCKA